MGRVGATQGDTPGDAAPVEPRHLPVSARSPASVEESEAMSQDLQGAAVAPDIRFDRADFGEGASAARCASCADPLAGSYFEINGAMVCPMCRAKVASAVSVGSPAGR